MSWHRSNAQRTGANEGQLANPRRWGDNGSPSGGSYGNNNAPGYTPSGSSAQNQLVGPPGERKRKSRWGDEKDKIQVAGLPTAISGNVQGKDLENYAIHVRLEEISRKLRSGDVIPPERERSPSPPPTYDHFGKRTNTRDIRYKKKLEQERNTLVEKAIKMDPNFKPPADYLLAKRLSGRPSEKIYIPVKEFPEIKWIGLILGPRGNSLKKMEQETGAKIVIRGKGSTKEGKSAYGNRSQDEDDELHCNVTADTQEKVDHCVRLINKVIATAASTPDEQNDHKRNQLRELAMLNGTLRDDENQPCQNCGKLGHRKYDCPEEKNFTASVICRNCGNMGHMARDCIAHRNKPNNGPGGPPTGNAGFDSEYSALMAELGEGPGGSNGLKASQGNNYGAPAPLKELPPWRRPENWHPPSGAQGGGAPGAGYGGGIGSLAGPGGVSNARPYQATYTAHYANAFGDGGYGGYGQQGQQGQGGFDYTVYDQNQGGGGGYGNGYGAAYA